MIAEIFEKGGPLMFPIVGCSVVSCALFFERVYQFGRATIRLDEFMRTLREKVRQSRYVEAITFCSETPGPVAAVLKSAVVKHERGRERMKEAMEESIAHELPRLEKNIPIIATVSHISPLLGLLGTVLGMIACFSVIQTKGGIVNPSDLAGGIAQALITTVGGLVVAIPSYLGYSYLVARVENFIVQMEKSGTEILDLIEDTKKEFSV